MKKVNYPITMAIRQLKENKVEFEPNIYDYVEKGGAKQTSIELGVDLSLVIKTIVLEADDKSLIVCLMHGDKEVSTKELARQIGKKSLVPADQTKAFKATGYEFGGTSPFGLKTKMKVYAESTIFDNEAIYINGGKRGFIIKINSQELIRILNTEKVNVGIEWEMVK